MLERPHNSHPPRLCVVIRTGTEFEYLHGINGAQVARAEVMQRSIDTISQAVVCCSLTVQGVVASDEVLEASKVTSCEPAHMILYET